MMRYDSIMPWHDQKKNLVFRSHVATWIHYAAACHSSVKNLRATCHNMDPLCRGMSSLFKPIFPIACRGMMVVILKIKTRFSLSSPIFPNSLNPNPHTFHILSTPLPHSLFQFKKTFNKYKSPHISTIPFPWICTFVVS